MADKKISELTNITGSTIADADEFVVVDASGNETKAITAAELRTAIGNGDFTVTGNLTVQGTTITVDSASAQNIVLGDNDKMTFGDAADLQIYHDGADSIIEDVGTGDLNIRANDNLRLQSATTNENFLKADSDGAVTLYNNNNPRLATTATGVDITGTLTSDGLTVDGDVSLTGDITSSTTMDIGPNAFGAGVNLKRGNGAVNGLSLTSGGDISFYEDTGTTAKFFWDASAESLGIGTSSPSSYGLSVEKSASSPTGMNIRNVNTGSSAYAGIYFGGAASGTDVFVGAVGDNTTNYGGGRSALFGTNASTPTVLITGGTERMRIDSNGSVGIGATTITSPAGFTKTVLSLAGSTAPSVVLRQSIGNEMEWGLSASGGWFGTSDGYPLRFATNNTERMRITSTGELLVGTTSDTMPAAAAAGQAIMAGTRTFIATETGGDTILGGTTGSNYTAIYQGGTERMRIDSSGNVGIGTSSPSSFNQVGADNLVVGSGSGDQGITIYSGTANNGALAFADGTTTTQQYQGYIGYNHSSNFMRFFTSATEAMRIDSSGNVGIGVTSISTQGQLYIGASGTSTNAQIGLSPTNSGGGQNPLSQIGASADGTYGSTLYFNTRSTGGTVSERMRIDSSGNVGIGTTSPSENLHVTNSTGSSAIKVSAYSSGNNDAKLILDGNGTGLCKIEADKSLTFSTDGGSSEAMRIDSSGNLLVGTTELSLYSETSGGETGWVFRPDGRLYNSRDGGINAVFNRLTSDGDIMQFRKDGATVGSIGAHSTQTYIGTGDTGLYFNAGNDSIDPYNTSTPVSRSDAISLGAGSRRFKDLYLSGGVKSGGTKSAYKDAFIFTGSATNCIAIDNSDGSGTPVHIGFFHSGTAVGSISTTASATSYNTSSDYRLKENVVELTGATDRIKQIPVHRFNFIADPDTTVDGFLAHEVQDIVPEAVTGAKDAMRDEEYEVTPAVLDDDGNVVTEAVMGTRSVPDYQGIDQSKLVPLLTAALQEALTKIDALETRISALEGN